MSIQEKLLETIRIIPDFPKKGILFKDLTPLLLDPALVEEVVDDIIENIPDTPDAVIGVESRGFWLGPLIALKLKVPFIPLRKAGKLPGAKLAESYDLEYGEATIEIHEGHVQNGWKVMVHDDLLATGGTAKAAARLLEREGAKVHSFTFIVNLDFLGGMSELKELCENTYAVINYY